MDNDHDKLSYGIHSLTADKENPLGMLIENGVAERIFAEELRSHDKQRFEIKKDLYLLAV